MTSLLTSYVTSQTGVVNVWERTGRNAEVVSKRWAPGQTSKYRQTCLLPSLTNLPTRIMNRGPNILSDRGNSSYFPVMLWFQNFMCSALSRYYYIPVNRNTALLSSHRGCSKDQIRPTLVLRPSTKLSLLLFRQF